MSTTFPEAIRPSVAALHAAMPYTRLTDCGMNPADARSLLAATVVVWGGLSSWGAAYLGTADALNARGLACLLAEGPGQGEPRLLSRLHMDEHVTDGFARFVDAIEADPRLGDAIGVQGNSFG